MWPGLDSGPVPYMGRICVGSRPASKVLISPVSAPVFLPPQNPTCSNFNSTRIEDPHKTQLRLMSLPLCLLKFKRNVNQGTMVFFY